MSPAMQQIRDETEQDDPCPNGGRPISGARVDGQTGGETAKDHGEPAVTEGERVDGQPVAAETPTRGGEAFPAQAFQADAADG